MDWLIGLLLLIVGVIIGFFVAKYVSKDKIDAQNNAENEKTLQEIMSQQATLHVQESKKMLESLLLQTHDLKQQIESYEQLLIKQNSGSDGKDVNFFGEHTSEYLRNKSSKQKREKSTAEVQPLDFSSQSSGLFSGSEQTNAEQTK